MNKKILLIAPILTLASLFNVSCNGNGEETGNLVYLENSDGYCVDSLNNMDRSKVTNIVVPNTYKGRPVNEISKGAFKGCTSLKSITLPFIGHTANSTGAGGLFGYVFGDEIWEGAGSYTWQYYSLSDEYDVEPTDYAQFVVPNSLRNVTITNAKLIAPGAFSCCRFLRNITFTDTCSVDEIGNFAFYTCTALKDVNFPTGVKTIGRQAFTRCYNIQEVHIPNTVTKIKHNAFSNCISLIRVYVPTSIIEMGKLVFQNMQAGVILLEAKEPGENWDKEWCNSSSTVVYDYDGAGFYYSNDCEYALCGKGDDKYAFLMQWTGKDEGEVTIKGKVTLDGKEYNVKTIGPRIFTESEISKVTIEEGVEKISAECFINSKELKSVTFPSTLKQIDASAFSGCSSLGISSNEDYNVIDFKNVVTIGKEAFKDCTRLVRIKFGDKLESIGDSAFENDERLMPGYLNDSGEITADPLVFPKTLKTIGKSAFMNCFKIEEKIAGTGTYYPGIKFEDNVNDEINIEPSAFENTGYKTTTTTTYTKYIRLNIDFGEGNLNKFKTFKEAIFKNSYIYRIYNFPTSLTSVNDYAFSNCRIYFIHRKVGEVMNETRDLIIDKDVTTLGNYSFYYNYCNFIIEGAKEKEEAKKSKLTSIGNYAFANCNQSVFNEFYIPNSVTSIGSYAFYITSYIAKIHFPHNDAYTKINSYAFSSMAKLTNSINDGGGDDDHVIVPKSVTYIANNAFSSNKKMIKIEFLSENITYVGSGCFASCETLKTVIFGSLQNCTTFGSSMFSNCYEFETIIGFEKGGQSSNKGIGDSCYLNCTSIKTQTISSNIQTIGAKAFSGCTSMTSIDFEGGLTHLYTSCFAGCSALTHFGMKDSVHTICDYAFQGCTSLSMSATKGKDSFVLPSNISQAYDTTSKMGMGDNVFSGWTSEQYIFFTDTNIKEVKEGDDTITLRWDWELKKTNTDNIYTCESKYTGGNARFVYYK